MKLHVNQDKKQVVIDLTQEELDKVLIDGVASLFPRKIEYITIPSTPSTWPDNWPTKIQDPPWPWYETWTETPSRNPHWNPNELYASSTAKQTTDFVENSVWTKNSSI